MEAIIALIGPILEDLLGIAENATSGQMSKLISMVEKYVQIAVTWIPSAIPSLQNIISELQGNAAVTPAQVAQLQTSSAVLDAALDAAAKDDGLTGV